MDTLNDHTIDTSATAAVLATPAAIPPTHVQFTGSIPENYDQHLGPLMFEFAAADIARRVADAVPAAKTVLEVACGTGIVTEHLWRALGRETRIIATDLNNAMLDYAITRRGALTNVTFEQADAQTLPYADATFDAVVCQFGLMFFPGKAAAIAEFARVLRPGGVLAFNVWDSFEHNRVAQIVHETIASFFEADPPDFLTIPFGYYETAPIEAAVAAAGLDGLQTGRVSAEIARPDATSIARGFIEGNPAILQIRERSTVEPGIIVAAAARAIEAQYGPAPLQIPLREITFVARKP